MEETIDFLEVQVKEMKPKLEISEFKLVDGERKIKVFRHDIAKIVESAETAEKRVSHLESIIVEHSGRVEELEKKEEMASDRGTSHIDVVTSLQERVKEAVLRAESAERMNAVLTIGKDEMEQTIASWKNKYDHLFEEISRMNDVVDDPRYDCFEVQKPDIAENETRSTSSVRRRSSVWEQMETANVRKTSKPSIECDENRAENRMASLSESEKEIEECSDEIIQETNKQTIPNPKEELTENEEGGEGENETKLTEEGNDSDSSDDWGSSDNIFIK